MVELTGREAVGGGYPLRRLRPARAIIGLSGVALAAFLGYEAGNHPLPAIGVGLVAIVALAIAARPDYATVAAVVILYSNAAAIAVKLYGLPTAIGSIVPMLLAIPLAYRLVARREPLIQTSALPFLAGLLIVEILSTIVSSEPGSAAAEVGRFVLEGVILYLLITNVVRNYAMLRQLAWALIAIGGFLGALSAIQQYTGTYGNDYLGFAQVSSAAFGTGGSLQRRLAGPLGDQNRYAQILLVLIPIGLFLVWSARSKLLMALAAGATALTVVGVALTFSRGAAVGFAVMLVVGTALRYIKLRQAAVIVAGLVLLLALFPAYQSRLSWLGSLSVKQGTQSQADTSNLRSRATEVLVAVQVFADHPILGVGPGQFPTYYRPYAERAYSSFLDIRAQNSNRKAHDLYAGIAAETGILGLFFFLAIVFVTLRDLARARKRSLRRSRPELAGMATSFFLAIVAYLGSGVFLHLAYQRYLWLLLALAGAAASVALRDTGDIRSEPAAASPHALGPP